MPSLTWVRRLSQRLNPMRPTERYYGVIELLPDGTCIDHGPESGDPQIRGTAAYRAAMEERERERRELAMNPTQADWDDDASTAVPSDSVPHADRFSVLNDPRVAMNRRVPLSPEAQNEMADLLPQRRRYPEEDEVSHWMVWHPTMRRYFFWIDIWDRWAVRDETQQCWLTSEKPGDPNRR